MKSNVVVVGSLNMDLVVQTQRRPNQGETLRGISFGMFGGGKGNNQAIAAARAGATVSMIGRLGNDAFGEALLHILEREGVDSKCIIKDPDSGTGIAHITVDADANNYIVIVPQANQNLCPADIVKAENLLQDCQVLLMQLEVPLEPLCTAAAMVRKNGGTVVLNPAPAPENGKLPQELLALVDIIVPNQPEAAQLTGLDTSTVTGAKAAASALHELGMKSVIITLGEAGALLSESGTGTEFRALKVKVIDTTAAGDAFCGALAASLASGRPLRESVKFASSAGALATTKLGAEPSLPFRHDIEALLKERAESP